MLLDQNQYDLLRNDPYGAAFLAPTYEEYVSQYANQDATPSGIEYTAQGAEPQAPRFPTEAQYRGNLPVASEGSPYDPRVGSTGLPNMEAMYGRLARGPLSEGAKPPSLTQRLASNPLLQAGLGILASNGNLGGAMVGLKSAAAAENSMRRQEQERQNAELRRRQQDLYEIQNRQNLMSMYGLGAQKPTSAYDQARIDKMRYEMENPAPTSARPHAPTPGAIVRQDGSSTPVPDIRDPEVYEGLPEGAAVLPASRVPVPGAGSSTKGGKKLQQLDQALATVGNLKEQALGKGTPGSPDYKPGAFTGVDSGMFDRAVAGLGNLWNKWNQPEADIDRMAESYERDLQSTLAVFAKAFGDSGVLSNQDVVRILNRMPRADMYPDTEAYAVDAFQRLEDELKEMRTGLTTPPVLGATPPQSGGGGLPEGVTVEIIRR